MKNCKLLLATLGLLACITHARADTNFVLTLNERWRSSNATAVITFLDSEYHIHSNDPQRAFASAIAAAELQYWVRGATNYMAKAIELVAASTNYHPDRRTALTNELAAHLVFLTNTISVFAEPENSAPQTNTALQAEAFEGSTDFPYTEMLEQMEP